MAPQMKMSGSAPAGTTDLRFGSHLIVQCSDCFLLYLQILLGQHLSLSMRKGKAQHFRFFHSAWASSNV